MSQTSRTFRIFVSSTFSDLKAERNALQERVFPRLRELAMAHGCRFQAIDLRWGVSEEAALDQQTMKICLGEIERCQKTSPRPNFIILLGNRYGWRPLPYQIPADEYDRIFQYVSPAERTLLMEWYRRDDNAVPAVAVLQPRTGAYESYEAWAPLEGRLHDLLETAARAVNLAEADLAKYTASATEQEILHGAIQVVNAREHIFCFAREMQAIPSEGVAKEFIDMQNDKPDTQAAGKLADLKSRLKRVLGDNYHEYAAVWRETGASLEHLDRLCDEVHRELERILLQEINTLEQVDPLVKEIVAHQAFGEQRACNFVGRDETLKQVDGYLLARNRSPLIISGEAGSGKSALMAKAIQMAVEKHPGACIITRFIGATPASSDRRSLLQGLCQQITRWYGVDESNIPSSYNDLVTDFSRRLSLASPEKPLIIFLDALDQFSGPGDSHRLDWLPLSLPPEACLVVSSLPGKELAEWSGKIPASNHIMLEPMSSSEGEKILGSWMAQAGRRLQKEQKDVILDHFQKNGNPLYLKLVFEQARGWHSYVGVPELCPDIPGMISSLFQHLSRESNHGQVLVAHSLGYLAAAKNGLSEDELIDLLSTDVQVKQDFLRRSPKSPQVEGLPVVLWSRLFFDLEPYLLERLADGTLLLNFYHQQVKLEAERDFLTGEAGRERHRSLAEYFARAPLQLETGGGKNPNLRKLSEQVFQQVQAGMQEAACATLLDFNFLQEKLSWYERSTRKDQTGQIKPEYNGVHHLLEDFALSLQAPIGIPAVAHQLLTSISTGLRKETHILTREADLAWQQLFNRLQWQGQAAEQFLAQAGAQFPPQMAWFRLRLPVEESRDLLFKLAGHRNPVEALAVSPDGRLVASASQDMTVRIWLLEEGREKFILQGHKDTVTDCDFHPGGNWLLSSSRDKTIKVWDVRDGRELVTLKGHDGRILRSRFSLDGSHILSLSDDNQLRIWETETGKHLFTFEGCSIRAPWKFPPDGRVLLACFNENQLHAIDLVSGDSVRLFSASAGPITSLALSTKAGWIAVADKSGGLNLHSFPKFAPLASLKGHSSAVRCCAIDPTDSLVLSGDRDGWLILHDRLSGEPRTTLQAFNNPVTHCEFSPDGRMFLAVSGVPAHSGGNDFRIRFWETSRGQEVASFVGHTNAVSACIFAAGSNRLISAGYDQALCIWQIPEEAQIVAHRPHQGVVSTCAFSPDGNHFITVGKDQLILWDAKEARCLHQTALTGEDGYWSSTFEPSGQDLLLCGKSVGKFSLTSKALTRLHKTHSSVLSMGECFAISADASLYAVGTTGGFDMSRSESREIHTIYVSRVRNGETLAKFEGHTGAVNAIAFHPNGQSILSGSSDTTVKGWLVGGGGLFNKPRNIFTFKGHHEPVSACAFHPHEQWIVSADAKGHLLLWEANSQKVLQSWQGHASYVSRLAFSKDGRYLLSAGFDNWGRMWEVPGMRLIASLPTTGRPVCVAFSPEAYLGCVGEESGNVYFFKLSGLREIR